jgi:hypothetical protein
LLLRNKLVHITYALANVFENTEDRDAKITEQHRARAAEMMACVENGHVIRLRELFEQVLWEATSREGHARYNKQQQEAPTSRQCFSFWTLMHCVEGFLAAQADCKAAAETALPGSAGFSCKELNIV